MERDRLAVLERTVRRAVALARRHRWHQAEAELRAGLALLPPEELPAAYLDAVGAVRRSVAWSPADEVAGDDDQPAGERAGAGPVSPTRPRPPADPTADYAHAILTALRRTLAVPRRPVGPATIG